MCNAEILTYRARAIGQGAQAMSDFLKEITPSNLSTNFGLLLEGVKDEYWDIALGSAKMLAELIDGAEQYGAESLVIASDPSWNRKIYEALIIGTFVQHDNADAREAIATAILTFIKHAGICEDYTEEFMTNIEGLANDTDTDPNLVSCYKLILGELDNEADN